MIETSMYKLAERFVGIKEVPGAGDNAAIVAMLRLDASLDASVHDETPWCSAFMNYIAWLLRLPRSKSLMARSWLTAGTPVALSDARQGGDIVILSRGFGVQPDASVLIAPGHVGLFSSMTSTVNVLGGNQGDAVSVAGFSSSRVLGVRRIHF